MSLTDDTAQNQAGFGELLRGNANVRRLWGGTVVSLFGDWFNTLALYRLALDLTGSEAALGGVFLTKLLPLALASPLAGVLVDRVDRKHVMIGADLVRAVIVLGFLFVRDAGDLWLLYTLAAAQIAVSATFTPAKNAILPGIAAPRELLTANALLSATWSTMLALGAAAGGPAVDAFGTDAVFLFDAATYLVSAAFIWRIRAPEARQPAVVNAAESAVRVAARQIWDGWRYLRQRPGVGRIALAKASWGAGGGGLLLALALVGERLFPGVGTTGIGVLLAARGIGTGIGPILARYLVPDARRWPTRAGAVRRRVRAGLRRRRARHRRAARGDRVRGVRPRRRRRQLGARHHAPATAHGRRLPRACLRDGLAAGDARRERVHRRGERDAGRGRLIAARDPDAGRRVGRRRHRLDPDHRTGRAPG